MTGDDEILAAAAAASLGYEDSQAMASSQATNIFLTSHDNRLRSQSESAFPEHDLARDVDMEAVVEEEAEEEEEKDDQTPKRSHFPPADSQLPTRQPTIDTGSQIDELESSFVVDGHSPGKTNDVQQQQAVETVANDDTEEEDFTRLQTPMTPGGRSSTCDSSNELQITLTGHPSASKSVSRIISTEPEEADEEPTSAIEGEYVKVTISPILKMVPGQKAIPKLPRFIMRLRSLQKARMKNGM